MSLNTLAILYCFFYVCDIHPRKKYIPQFIGS